uniref:Uncharacterized protein n=1 Tax=Timema bartmani TaxID=61472 RepID=A0A7R9ENH2_9NEOP|nr:unnamed protein product [Timema bartmani]
MRQQSFDWLIARFVTTFLFCTCFSVNVWIHSNMEIMKKINAIVVTLALRAAMAAGMGKGKSRANKIGEPERRMVMTALRVQIPWTDARASLLLLHPSRRSERSWGGWLKGWFSLCSLLGVTWVFGLAFMEYYPSFEYIFVILNGCQGVFIFLFRCLLNKQVRSSVLNEAKQRASIKKFNRVAGNRSSWYIASQPPSIRHPSVGSGLGNSDSDSEIKQKEDYPDPIAVKSLGSLWSPVYTITPVPNESSNPHSKPWLNRGFSEFVNKCPMIEEEKDNDK